MQNDGSVLAVWRGVESHWCTSEWSAGGLGRTIASIVAVGGRDVLLGERRIHPHGGRGRGGGGEGEWLEWFGAEIPIFIPSHIPLPARSVDVAAVVRRWVRIVRKGERID